MLLSIQHSLMSFLLLIRRLCTYLLWLSPVIISLPALRLGYRGRTVWYSTTLYCIGEFLPALCLGYRGRIVWHSTALYCIGEFFYSTFWLYKLCSNTWALQ